jgi:hypothetical protein
MQVFVMLTFSSFCRDASSCDGDDAYAYDALQMLAAVQEQRS